MIGTRACTLGNTAQHLGKHPKALQRSLQSNGTSFKQLLAEERKDISQHYLRDSDLPLHQISAILGYSSPSAFSRAFTQQHGVSPIIWRTMQ
jgi:AraC-like DNA-binding protein